MKQTLSLKEWKEIGKNSKAVRVALFELLKLLNKLPKTKYLKKWRTAEAAFGKLRSHLDNMVCEKFLDLPNKEITHIFYGNDEKE